MQITDVITSPWAILPEKLQQIQSVYAAHVRGEAIDISAVEARIGKPLISEPQGYQVDSGVAIIPVSGIIAKKMNMMSQISGGASTQLIARDIRAALDDPNVKSILLHIDSPGGTVDGTQTLVDVVRAAKQRKPVVSFADEMMASAAYWIGSAADEIVAASDTTQIGSIGVVMAHTDVSKAEAAAGIKTTEISAGRYKRIASQYAPLSEEGAAHLQEKVDQIYTIFVDQVATNRGTDAENVLQKMADGRVFLSREAERRGMIDRVASLEITISNMAKGVWPMKPEKDNTAPQAQDVAANKIDMETLRANHPDIVAALHSEGAQEERARIQACESAGLAGHEALVNSMKYDGKSTAGDVALAIVGAENKLRAQHLGNLRADAPPVVPLAPVPAVERTTDSADASLPLEERAKARWDNDESIRKEFGTLNKFVGWMKVEENAKSRRSA